MAAESERTRTRTAEERVSSKENERNESWLTRIVALGLPSQLSVEVCIGGSAFR